MYYMTTDSLIISVVISAALFVGSYWVEPRDTRKDGGVNKP